MAPYVPPPLRGMEFILLNKNDLYIRILNQNDVYTERLALLLKEECSFINHIYFIKKEDNKNEYN